MRRGARNLRTASRFMKEFGVIFVLLVFLAGIAVLVFWRIVHPIHFTGYQFPPPPPVKPELRQASSGISDDD